MSMKIEFEASNSKNLVKAIVKFLEEMGHIVTTNDLFNAAVDKKVEELRQAGEVPTLKSVEEPTKEVAKDEEPPKAESVQEPQQNEDTRVTTEVEQPFEPVAETTEEQPQEVAPVEEPKTEEPTQEEQPTEEVNADEPNSVLMDALNKLREWVVSDKEAVQIRNNAVIGFIRQHGYVEGMKAEDWAKTADPALAPQLLALIK